MNSVFEFAWLATQQVLVSSDASAEDIKGYGSGFFYSIVISFFITADHVAHIDDFEEGLRLGKDDFLWVINNKIVQRN